MDIDKTVILDNLIIFFNYQDCIDLSEQRSNFIASNANHLIITKMHTLKKLDFFLLSLDLKIDHLTWI